MNTKKITVSLILAAMFMVLPNQADAKAKPKKAGKSRFGTPDLTGVRSELHVYKDKPHGFFNADDYMRATMLLADKFLTSLGYLEGKATIDTKGLNTPEVDLKTAGK